MFIILIYTLEKIKMIFRGRSEQMQERSYIKRYLSGTYEGFGEMKGVQSNIPTDTRNGLRRGTAKDIFRLTMFWPIL